jgi:SpoVK/Ycf46/Vps4 family AAA+-type ATPase
MVVPAQLRDLSDVASSSSYGAARLSWRDFFGNAETVSSLARVLRVYGREASSQKAPAGSSYAVTQEQELRCLSVCEPASLSVTTMKTNSVSGAVLYGPPGGGKTFLARIAAHECGLNFVSIKSPQLMSKYFGQTEATIRDVFARAREARPCLLFFDDFDALACRRSDGVADEGGTGLQTRVLSTFLNELDGITGAAGDGGLLVLVACNDLSVLDEALLRPGRLQHHFYVGPLSSEDLGAMLLRRLSPMVDADGQVSQAELESLVFQQMLPRLVLAGVTMTGADVEALVRAAVWAAIREQRGSEAAPALLPRHVLSILPPPPPPTEAFVYSGSTAFSVGVGGGF